MVNLHCWLWHVRMVRSCYLSILSRTYIRLDRIQPGAYNGTRGHQVVVYDRSEC